VTFCSDLESYNEVFDYNRIVKALQFNEITIDNVTSEELVNYSVWLRDLQHEFAFRLKYMQVVALVTGDEFLAKYNLTIDTADVVDYIRILSTNWTEKHTRLTSYFDDYYGTDFAAIISPFGFCYNFNLIEADRLFEINQMPASFNYSKEYYPGNQVLKYRIMTQEPNKPYPLSIVDYRAGLVSMIPRNGYGEPFDVNHHEKFTTQGLKYFIHQPFEMLSRNMIKHESIVNHSMIIYVNPQKMIINEALESYEPQRFVKTAEDSFKLISSCPFRRNCYLPNEKPLKFFKFYTKNNCRSECLANRTMAACGCAQFYMVRDVEARICGVADMKCFKKIEDKQKTHDPCECYIECGEIEYKTEQQQNEFVQ
jgi:hypothetical protein